MMLCYFQVYRRVNQWYIDIYPLLFRCFFFFLYRLLHSIEVTYLKLCNYQHNRDPDKFCHFPHTLQIPSCCLFIVNPSLHPQDRSSANLLELICFDCFFFLLISFMQQLSIESTMCWALLEVLGMIWWIRLSWSFPCRNKIINKSKSVIPNCGKCWVEKRFLW